MTTSTAAGPRFDPASFTFSNTEIVTNPYPAYDMIREADPIHHSPMYGGSWLLFSYADAAALLEDPRLTNNRAELPLLALPEQARPEFDGFLGFLRTWTAFFEGEEHLLRRTRMDAVFRTLTPAVVSAVVQDVSNRLLDRWEGRDRADLVTDYARLLPAMTLTTLLGGPEDDHERLDHWADEIAYLFGASALTVEDVRRGEAAARSLMAYLRGLTKEVAKRPRLSLLGQLMSREQPGFGFSGMEACAQCVLLLFAGLEPSRHLIGNAMLALRAFPDQRELLMTNPRLWAPAVEEFLRYDPPVQYIGRLAAETFTYQGRIFKKGQAVLPFAGSANRDPERFADPTRLDIRRRGGHLSMGRGIHRCVGAALVRVQTAVALRTLLTRFPDVQVIDDPPPVWQSYVGFHGLKSLAVSL